MTQTPETLRHYQILLVGWNNWLAGKSTYGQAWYLSLTHLWDLHDGEGDKGFLHGVLSPPHTPLPQIHTVLKLSQVLPLRFHSLLISLCSYVPSERSVFTLPWVFWLLKRVPKQVFLDVSRVSTLCCTNFIWFCFLKDTLWACCHRQRLCMCVSRLV